MLPHCCCDIALRDISNSVYTLLSSYLCISRALFALTSLSVVSTQ
jgi:hypothetical protein